MGLGSRWHKIYPKRDIDIQMKNYKTYVLYYPILKKMYMHVCVLGMIL